PFKNRMGLIQAIGKVTRFSCGRLKRRNSVHRPGHLGPRCLSRAARARAVRAPSTARPWTEPGARRNLASSQTEGEAMTTKVEKSVTDTAAIDAYVAKAPEPFRGALEHVRAGQIHRARCRGGAGLP